MIRFQQKETLSNVSSFKVSENQLAYCSQDTIYLDKVKIVEGTSSYFFYQNRLYFHQNSTTFLLNGFNGIIKVADFSFNFDTLFEDTIIIGRNIKVEDFLTFEISTTYEIVNVLNFHIEKKLPYRYSNYLALRFKYQYFGSDIKKTILRSLSLLTGEYEWGVDLGEYGEIRKILGLVEGLLWVIVSGNETTKRSPSVVGVSPQSGSVEQYFDNRSRLFDIHGVQFSADKKSLVCFNHYFGVATYLFELNLPDLSIKREVRLRELEELDTQMVHFTLHDGLVYFTARKGRTLAPTRLGVLDFTSLQLHWHENIIEDGSSLNQAPKVGNNKLYALDSGGTLHIFEQNASGNVT